MSTYLAVIPARGGSKRIPNKNLAMLGNRPLLDYTVRAALESVRLDAVVVSTDSDAIAERARQLGLSVPAMRPTELAQDSSPTVHALRHALAAYEVHGSNVDAVVVLQPTSPFRTARHIDQAIELFERSEADTVAGVRSLRDHPYWAWRRAADDAMLPYFSMREMTMERGERPEAFAENGAIYIVRSVLVRGGSIYGARVVPYVMDEIASVDIDTPLDLAWAEFVLARDAS